MCVFLLCLFFLRDVRGRFRGGGVQGSSSESNTEGEKEEDEEEGAPGGTSSDEGGEGSRESLKDGDTSNLDTSSDDDTKWMSDAESVGSDEVAKLHSEAGDFADIDSDHDDVVSGW